MKARNIIILAALAGLGCMSAALPAQAEQPVNIPLYLVGLNNEEIVSAKWLTADSPGSSTVDPIDPNQIRAELCDNILTIHENIPGVIVLTVINQNNGQRIVFAEIVDNTTSVTLEEMATYLIFIDIQDGEALTGKFSYPYNAGEKQMLNGQLYIRSENGVYTLQGTKL